MSCTGKKVVICGATGNQGNSVLTALQAAHPTLCLVAITRDAKSEKARAIAATGVEVVEASFDDAKSLKQAFKDAYAVFAVTNYMDPEVMTNPAKEVQQGKNLADAAKEAGVQLYIWPAGDSVKKVSKGKYSGVVSFDNKAEIADYVKSIGLPAVFVFGGFFATNLSTFMGPQPGGPDGKTPTWYLPLDPKKVIPITDINVQMGEVVSAIMVNPKKYIGQRIDVAPCYLKMEDIPKIYTKVTGQPAAYVYLPMEQWEKNVPPGPLRDLLVQMFGYFNDFGYYAGRSLSGMPEGVTNHGWEEYLIRTGWRAQV